MPTTVYRHIITLLTCCCLASCVGTPAQQKSQDVSIAPIGAGTSATQTGIKREQLAAEIMRFADRYSGRMAIESNRIYEKADTSELRRFASAWNLGCQKAVLDISIGPNAVENLLDMLVFTTLTRIEVEDYFVPKYLGAELGEGLIRASRQLEEELWSLSQKVMTTDQQADLRQLISEWKKANPDTHYFWFVRFDGFSGQRAQDLEQLEQTGGLLAEVQMTREAADEMRQFSERLLHYLQRAPSITRLEAQFGLDSTFNTPEVIRLLEDLHRVSMSSDRYATIAENLPDQSNATLDHLFDRLSHERETAILQLYEKLSQERIAAIDQLASRQLEIVSQLLASKELEGAAHIIAQEGNEIANITFIRVALLILLWVISYIAGKLIYDYIKYRIAQSRQQV